jgi:hypothetical protein
LEVCAPATVVTFAYQMAQGSSKICANNPTAETSDWYGSEVATEDVSDAVSGRACVIFDMLKVALRFRLANQEITIWLL